MRITTKLEVRGSTIAQIMESLETEWQTLSETESANLPLDSEIIIEKDQDTGAYVATCIIRSKK